MSGRGTSSLQGFVGLLLGGAIAGVFSVWGEEGKDDVPQKVGVIDLGRALASDPEARAESDRITKWAESRREGLRERQRDIADLEVELGEYEEGGEEAIRRGEALMLEQYRLELSVERLRAEVDRKRSEATRACYTRVVAATEAIRAKHGLEVVLQINPGVLGGRDLGEAIHEMIARTVVAHDGEVDVTDKVIAFLKQ